MQIVPIVGRTGEETESEPGESQDMLPRATGTETARPRRRPDRCGVERLLAADPGAFVAAPTAFHGRCETLTHLPAPGPAAKQAFNRVA